MPTLQRTTTDGGQTPPQPGCEADRDRAILVRIKGGDQAPFSEIVQRYRGRIYALAFQLLGNRQDAEEVTQDAFVHALRGLPHFRGDALFSTWLYQIATNGARNRYAYWQRRKRAQTVSLEAPLAADGPATLADFIPAAEDSPDEAVVNEDLLERVRYGISLLDSPYREALALRSVHDASYEEIARILMVSVGTVKSRLARARESLRAVLRVDQEAGCR